jgi:hypothetical protein
MEVVKRQHSRVVPSLRVTTTRAGTNVMIFEKNKFLLKKWRKICIGVKNTIFPANFSKNVFNG